MLLIFPFLPPLWCNHKFVFYVSESFSILYIDSFLLSLDYIYMWFHIVFVFLWLTSLSMIISRSFHVSAYGNISFYGWVMLHCVYVCVYRYMHVYTHTHTHTHTLHLLYPFFCWWALGLFPCISFRKQCCYEHWGAFIFLNYSFHIFRIYTQEWDCWIIW